MGAGFGGRVRAAAGHGAQLGGFGHATPECLIATEAPSR